MADSVFVRGGHRTYNLAHQPTCMGSRRRRRRAAKPAPPAAVQPTVATTTPRPTSILLVAALLAIITLTVYAPARHYDFVTLDDPLYVSENPHVAALTPDNIAWAWTNSHGGFWIPLVWMSYMVDVTVFGPGAGGHHITNVALHVLNTLLLFCALNADDWRRSGGAGASRRSSPLHPLHVESVAWITERKDVLSGCFWMLALVAYTALRSATAPVALRGADHLLRRGAPREADGRDLARRLAAGRCLAASTLPRRTVVDPSCREAAALRHRSHREHRRLRRAARSGSGREPGDLF